MIKELIEAATNGKIHLEFSQISLSRNGLPPDPAPLQGAGYLIQDDKTLRFTFFPNEKAQIGPMYFLRQFTTASYLVPDDAFFTAHCVTPSGLHWTIKNILPYANSGPAGSVVHATVSEAEWDESLPTNLGAPQFGTTLYFLGKQDFEPNQIVETKTTIGNDTSSHLLSLSIAEINCVPDMHIRIQQFENHTELCAWSDKPLPETFRIAAWQALEFILGRILVCVLTTERHAAQSSGVVRAWVNPEEQPYCEPPLSPRNINTQSGYWPLFCKFLSRIMQTDSTSETLASCSSDIISVGNSLLGVQGLVRCVAVESVCKLIAQDESANDKSFEKDRTKLVEHVAGGGYSETFAKRIRGAVDAMKSVSVKDTLYCLKAEGIVEEGHITSWSKLRHSRVHGRVVNGITAENDLIGARAVIGLFYRLVFHIIGYTGPSKDYLKPEPAPIKVITKEQIQKELAAQQATQAKCDN